MLSKRCGRCGKKISKKYDFCPYCGARVSTKEEIEKNFGLIGKRDLDFSEIANDEIKLPFGFNMLFKSLTKQIERQMRELDKELGKEFKQEKKDRMKTRPLDFHQGISISVSSTGTGKPLVKVNSFPPGLQRIRKSKTESRMSRIDAEKAREFAEKFAKLPRKEASTNVRRLSNKIIYEIDMPGVKSLKDIIINRLENSIEIKAITEDKILFKLIPLNLPILRYGLRKGKLIIEFAPG